MDALKKFEIKQFDDTVVTKITELTYLLERRIRSKDNIFTISQSTTKLFAIIFSNMLNRLKLSTENYELYLIHISESLTNIIDLFTKVKIELKDIEEQIIKENDFDREQIALLHPNIKLNSIETNIDKIISCRNNLDEFLKIMPHIMAINGALKKKDINYIFHTINNFLNEAIIMLKN